MPSWTGKINPIDSDHPSFFQRNLTTLVFTKITKPTHKTPFKWEHMQRSKFPNYCLYFAKNCNGNPATGSSWLFFHVFCSVWNILVSTVMTSCVLAFGCTVIVIATQKVETTLDEEEEEPADLSSTCAALHHNRIEKRNTCSSETSSG